MITGRPYGLEAGVFELIYCADCGETQTPSASRERKASWHQLVHISLLVAGQLHGPRPNPSAVLLVVALAPTQAPGQRPGARLARTDAWGQPEEAVIKEGVLQA